MGNKVITVIVSTYNNGSYLYETLQSILEQDYCEIELIIADDGSQDFSEKEIENFIDAHKMNNLMAHKIIHRKNNIGTVRNLNKAVAESSGAYIKMIAGDDKYADKDVFSKDIRDFCGNPDAQIVVTNVMECDLELHEISSVGFAPNHKGSLLLGTKKQLLRAFCRDNPGLFALQSMCIKRKVFEKEVFDERLELVEDLPFAVRVINNEIPFVYRNRISVFHRASVGVSSEKKIFDKTKLRYYKDIEAYYRLILLPIDDIVGKPFVKQRCRLCEYRVQRCVIGNNPVKRLQLFLKYLPAVFYYCITNFGGIARKLKQHE